MVKRRVMPSDPAPRVRLRSPLLARSGLVSAWDLSVGAAAFDSEANPSALHLEVRGEFTEEVSGFTAFELLVVGEEDRAARIDRYQTVGIILRCRPLVDCVVTLSALEFQALLTLAAAGRLATVQLRFERPLYGKAFIESVRFNSDRSTSAVSVGQPSGQAETNETPEGRGALPMGADARNEILERLDALTSAVVTLARVAGVRLTRAEMCNRLGVSSNTLTACLRRGDVPTPGRDGKWLLAEVVEWESRGG
jgi:hypothetical protein